MDSAKNLTIKIVSIVMFFACCVDSQAINLDKIHEKKRNKILLAMAKEIVLRYGPDYYREAPIPNISRYKKYNSSDIFIIRKNISLEIVNQEVKDLSAEKGAKSDTAYYAVTYLPKFGESFEYGDAAEVHFLKKTGLPIDVYFGNGKVVPVSDVFKKILAHKYYGGRIANWFKYRITDDKDVITQVEYQQSIPRRVIIKEKWIEK